MGSSLLQRNAVKHLDRIYGCHAVQENVRPEWLRGPNGHRLELDVFVETAKIAIEVQGPQHYRFSEHFHGNAEGFQKQTQRDNHKRIVCSKRGIALYEIASHSDLQNIIAKLKNKPARPDPKHAQRSKELFKLGQERLQADDARWFTRKHRAKLRQAIESLKIAVAALPPGIKHSADTDKASALIIRRRNQLEKAERRAQEKREFGPRGYRK